MSIFRVFDYEDYITKSFGSSNPLTVLIFTSILLYTNENGITLFVTQAPPPIVECLPITVSPPRMVAPAYITTLSSTVGCRFIDDSFFSRYNAPNVTP